MICDPSEYNGLHYSFVKKSLKYVDYIEIGTCDWDTFSMEKPHLKGIIIEPIKFYLDNIPNNSNVIKVNCAISNRDGKDNMFYIPSDTIEKHNIINCFRGMNKLGSLHMGHISNNLQNYVRKENCDTFMFKTLLKNYNVNYVDFLKIDTEGNDCTIINNILDELNEEYNILPMYLLFENNNLTDIETRTNTINKLYEYGYVHIFTKDENTFMYNCKTYFDLYKYGTFSYNTQKNITNNNKIHYFKPVHSYVDTFVYLFKKMNYSVSETPGNADIIWSTQEITEHTEYRNMFPEKTIIDVCHGGTINALYNIVKSVNCPNFVLKSIDESKILKTVSNNTVFIGKYEAYYNLFDEIYKNRDDTRVNAFNKCKFLMLNGFFEYNCQNVKNVYNILVKKYDIMMFGYDNPNGWLDVVGTPAEVHPFLDYAFFLHLKGIGYLCNSVIMAFMSGIPVIMTRENYKKTLYCQFIPEDLIIFIENSDVNCITCEEVEIAINKAKNMSINDYINLSWKSYLHGKYFRKYFKDETINILNYVNLL